MVLGYPDVGRSGLGNALFPWARCLLWCHRHQVPMVAPVWFRLRIGPYLRRERDKRAYHRLFTAGDARGGPRRLLALATQARLPEPASLDAPPAGDGLVTFAGMGRLFEPLRGQAPIVLEALARITRPALRPAARAAPFLAVHVRRGDFSTPAGPGVLSGGHHNYRIGIEWYLEALRALRGQAGGAAPAVIYSDGTDEELAPLLAEQATTRSPSRSAITDLLDMSGAAALVASGSTFSMWASYLGQVPTLWHPGQRRQLVLGGGDQEMLEPEWDGGALSRDFLDALVGEVAGRRAAHRPQA